ncbi:KNL1 protein, partial [Chloroceryle aenea]|nr:KNL1 protein [Chloroceryle aenea]
MEKICIDPNMENDNTEHIRRKRLSSILKAPRNPLDDLGNGNELTQDINIEKRRKNSRRVSFANTIEVFQRDLKNNTSESTGMNTLLHAPIQAVVQQTEEDNVDNTIQMANRHNTTLIFADENEMDMTSSHTAVITRNLQSDQADETEKIDITSFLSGLNSNSAKAEGSKEFTFFSDPTIRSCPSLEQKEDVTAVKKINFYEFLKSLKSNEEAPNPIEGPDKENIFYDPSQVSEDVARPLAEFVYSHEPLDTCNVTQVFRGQDDGMDMTKCQAPDGKAATMSAIPGSISSETVFRDDKTLFFSKCDDMEMTGNYTDVIYSSSTKEMNRVNGGCQNIDRQEKTHTLKVGNKTLPTGADSERDFSTGRRGEDFNPPCSVGGLHSRGAAEPSLANPSEPRKGSSQLPSFLEKSVVFPSGENMDLTGNCTVMIPDYVDAALSGEAVPGTIIFPSAEDMEITKISTALLSSEISVPSRESVPAGSAVAADKTTLFAHNQDDMEITASHTVAVNNNINGFENRE